VGTGVQLASGRVIALGRLLLAILFLGLGIMEARGTRLTNANAALLIGYAVFAIAALALTWRSWWLDARLAGFTHAVDIALFTLLVYLTNGDNNPFFTFSIFIFLAAAMRWGWRATTLTAILLALLFFLGGSAQASVENGFHFSDFVAGAGQLAILAVILIWFGVNQRRAEVAAAARERAPSPPNVASPFEAVLRSAMAQARAARGGGTWSRYAPTRALLLIEGNEPPTLSLVQERAADAPTLWPFLYDFDAGRALRRDAQGNLQPFEPARVISSQIARTLGISEGLAVPVQCEAGLGQLFLERVPGLSTDHLELGARIGAAAGAQLDREAFMRAAEEQAEARSRLSIARDLHDSVVQFLAGAAFRLEAMKRSEATGRAVTPDLEELKDLMLQEQGELRSFISALRTGSQVEISELAADLQGLARRLSSQWGIQCTFSVEGSDIQVPARLHLDAQQLVREAVANAARHAGAKTVSIRLAGEEGQVRLELINDGAAFPKAAGQPRLPSSLQERVETVGGTIDVSRGMGVTRLSIALPTAEAAR